MLFAVKGDNYMSKKKTVLIILLSLVMLISFVGSIINVTDIIKNAEEEITTVENAETTSEKPEETLTLPGQDIFNSEEESEEAFQKEKKDSEKAAEEAKSKKKKVSEGEAESVAAELVDEKKESFMMNIEGKKLFNTIGFAMIFILSFAAVVFELTGASASVSADALKVSSIGKINNIGKRSYQQDSVGADIYDDGAFGIVADGMGGLSGGDEISSAVVINMLQNAQNTRNIPFDEVLINLSSKAINEVNRKLGVSGYYKSGSTLVAVYAKNGRFHWMSIGDSRIYLYRNGALMQINREHTYENELLHNVLNSESSFNKAKSDPQANKLTSFIGMGKIKYSDLSTRSVKLVKGDRILLMSDGVFGTLSENEIATIIRGNHDCEIAAKAIEDAVSSRNKPGQDNFTALIIGF